MILPSSPVAFQRELEAKQHLPSLSPAPSTPRSEVGSPPDTGAKVSSLKTKTRPLYLGRRLQPALDKRARFAFPAGSGLAWAVRSGPNQGLPWRGAWQPGASPTALPARVSCTSWRHCRSQAGLPLRRQPRVLVMMGPIPFVLVDARQLQEVLRSASSVNRGHILRSTEPEST